MPYESLNLDVDHIVDLYRSGKTTKEIGIIVGASSETIKRRLRARGEILPVAEATRRYFQRPEAIAQARAAQVLGVAKLRRDDIDASQVIHLYVSEMLSIAVVAETIGCSGPTVVRILREAGVSLRDKSTAGNVRAAREPSSLRAERAAHRAALRRGIPASEQQLSATATTKERNMTPKIGRGEAEVSAFLAESGFQVSRQIAVGRYNLDITADGIAVEIHTHAHGPHLDRFGLYSRIDNLTDQAIRVVYVWCPKRGISANDLEKLAALLHHVSTQPAVRGKYWMLRCYGEAAPRRGGDSYHGAYVATTSRSLSPISLDGSISGNA